MKTILALSILFCAIALPALAELTDADLNEIRLIVNDAEKRIKTDIKADIAASEKQMKEYINTKNESIEKRLSLVTTLIVGLMAIIGVPLVVLTIMIGWRSVKDNPQNIEGFTREQMTELVLEQMTELTSEDKRVIEELIRDKEQKDQKIESLAQEIETLKQERIVNP